MKNFRDMKFRILIATDVAARGIDVPHIEHVINYDLPQMAEDFIHRIGRTARAGSKGIALSFVTKGDFAKWKEIQKILNPEKNLKNQNKFKNKNKRSTFKKKSDYKKSSDQKEKKYSKNKFKKNKISEDFNSDKKIKFSRKNKINRSPNKKKSLNKKQNNATRGDFQRFNSPRKRRNNK